MASALKPEVYRKLYTDFAEQNPKWNEIPSSTGAIYEWDASSTYIQEPPFFTNFGMKPGAIAEIAGARALGIFGDSVTTDHISPAGAIKKTSPAGKFLMENGVADVLQVDYSMVQPAIGEALFPLAEEHGTGILVRMPMARGILTGKFEPGKAVSKEYRASMLGDKVPGYVDQAVAFARVMPDDGLTLGQFALRYAITPKAVSAAIPSARNLEQLTQNVAASNGHGLYMEELAGVSIVQARWQRNP